MRSFDQEYVELEGRIKRRERDLAFLTVKEEEKARERDGLEKELMAAGIDLKDPEVEKKRLTEECEKILKEQREQVELFEKKMDALLPRSPTEDTDLHIDN